jgi:hypothetical protein
MSGRYLYMDEADANTAIKALDAVLVEKRAKVKRLQDEIDLYLSKHANLSFQLERERGKKRPVWWMILLMTLFMLKCTGLMYGHYAVYVICEYSFLACWRGLYVRDTSHAVPVAICCVVASLYFL